MAFKDKIKAAGSKVAKILWNNRKEIATAITDNSEKKDEKEKKKG